MLNGTAPNVVEVIGQTADGLKAAQDNGRAFRGCVILVVDYDGGWAATTSGLSLEQLQQFLQAARDDAVRGGDGFTVMIPKDEPKMSVVQ